MESRPVSTAPLSGVNQHQPHHFGCEDAPFMNIPADSLHDDHNDPYVPSGDDESDDPEQAGQISNSEVCSSNATISLMFMTLQLADNLPRVTTKKKERRAAAQAKQVVGTGKRKQSSNRSKPAPAKRCRAEPSPGVVPTTSSVDCQQADDVFASRKRKAAVSSLLVLISKIIIHNMFPEISLYNIQLFRGNPREQTTTLQGLEGRRQNLSVFTW